MDSLLWRWLFVFLCFSIRVHHAADVCFDTTPHKDVSPNAVAAIVEKSTDSQQCISRCATLKDTLPCKGVVYVETTARNTRALCKMYSRSAKQSGNLVDVTDISHNDATYYDIQDQCTPSSQKLNIDMPAIAPGTQVAPGGQVPPGAQVDPSMTTSTAATTTFSNPMPGVIIVQPGPGGSVPGGAPGPGTDPNGSGGGYTPPPSYAGGYNAWSAWGPCASTCGGGTMYRNRVCGTSPCEGPDKELKTCYARKACPMWGPWTEWGPCSCSGQQTRSRGCGANYGCMGSSTDSQSCSSYGASCNPQPVYAPQPVYVPRPVYAPPPRPAPQPDSYYAAIHNQYYRNRG